ncbi:UNVERIFIED_CONTAM: Phytosulfokine receptor 2 [Sesamum radiatum]|uniref:Phytosulfokine receptor 2 n=1 Tax=Sesamum radiatum TaxID=300843 RepID=A0AAW2M568_SESRA
MDQTLQAVLAATASFFVVSLILASILIICKGDAKRRRNNRSISPVRARNSALPKPNTAPHAGLSSIYTGESATFDPSLNHVSMQELVEVTGNFSPDLIIGDGSFGLVYKARLNSGSVVAVKKLSPDAFQGLREFRAEMETLDFGLARRIEGSHSHVSTQVAGTMGYMPPEYLHGATKATVVGDVYSFGVLMLEIVAGRRPSFPFSGEDGKEVRLMEWINKMVEEKRYMEMVDASISKDDLDESMVVEIFKIGLKCADEMWKLRPSMEEVVEHLDRVLA